MGSLGSLKGWPGFDPEVSELKVTRSESDGNIESLEYCQSVSTLEVVMST